MPYKDPEKQKAYKKAYHKEYNQRPEVREQRRAWAREYSQSPKRKALKKRQRARRREARQEYLRIYLSSHPCTDCGEAYILVLDFHHRDPKPGDVKVPRLATQGKTLERIIAEIAKCDVLCKNCHFKRHGKKGFDDAEARVRASWRQPAGRTE